MVHALTGEVMNTNQTIDGALRRTLDRALNGCGLEKTEALKELRALLDRDKVNNRQMGLMQFVEAHPIKPAAQPQGEPFGYWLFPKGLPLHGMFHRVTASDKIIDSQSVVDAFEITPLYAEQPAPVAVVMPERREIGPNYPYLSDLDIEWNACLDELKSLNTTRPAHANPPPGTEPCGTHHDNDGLDDWRKP